MVNAGGIPALVELLDPEKYDDDVQAAAAVALRSLTTGRVAIQTAVAATAIPDLVRLLGSAWDDTAAISLAWDSD
jgi:hypothetical protein